ncbi:hypothetical protein AAFF_G00389800 [Aldrovandia affinis]|uniref:Uncharacterized protein n=1 Tax=Aldrovandia affinis TaxID=143900 RepID=A0AAD7WLC6_9TELE|nr:hypothetical protein AAFF_G00389800 [Aldrovandia affinis]
MKVTNPSLRYVKRGLRSQRWMPFCAAFDLSPPTHTLCRASQTREADLWRCLELSREKLIEAPLDADVHIHATHHLPTTDESSGLLLREIWHSTRRLWVLRRTGPDGGGGLGPGAGDRAPLARRSLPQLSNPRHSPSPIQDARHSEPD